MKKAFKKVIAVLLVTVMVFGAAPLAGFVGLDLPEFSGFKRIADSVSEFFDGFAPKAEAATEYTDGYYTYTVDDNGNATITDVDSSISGDITIPSTLGGYPVTNIGFHAFESCSKVTNVTIPDSVTSIGPFAFFRCDSLISITIPDSVTSIENNAFTDCDSLTSITIPDSVTNIDGTAFSYCNSLSNITVDPTNIAYSNDEYGVLYNKDKTELIRYPIGNTRTTYPIPNSVTFIGNWAFNNCNNITNITIPNSVTFIGNSAFNYCQNLVNITIGSGVTQIGYYDSFFYGCDSLESITVDPKNTAYSNDEYGVLYNKDKTELIRYPIGNTRTTYSISNSVTNIRSGAFEQCDSLTGVTIPDSVISIGNSAFSGCDSLSSIIIPESVTSISSYTFHACSSLEDVYYTGTEEQWNAISIGNYNESLLNATIHYNYLNDDTLVPYYIVYFYVDEKLLEARSGPTGSYIASVVNPSKDGATFMGWYDKNDNKVEFPIIIGNDDLKLYAKWNKDSIDQERTKKMSVFTNNMSLSYFKGDKIYFSVTEIEDGIWNIPENIMVTSSDNSILKFIRMGKKDWFRSFLASFAPTKYEKLKSSMSSIIPEAFDDCKIICFEAINPGNAVVTITNNDTGEKVEIPISVSDDMYYSLRADRVPENDWSLEILGKEVEHDIYNYNVNGMMVTDFEYTEIGNAYNFKMNIYNRKYSSGVVEVYDENYNLIEVHKISGRDTSTTGLVETFEAGWGLVKSISDYDMLSFRAPHQTKHTPIDIKVPKGGGIIITNDSAASTSCFLFNLFDAALSTRSLISDVQSLPEGQIDIIEKKLLENLIADKVRMELADSLKEKAADLVLEDISDAAVKSLIKSIDQIIYEYMESLDIDLNEICKTAVKETGGELIEDVFGKYAGPAGATINALFMGEKFHEFYIKILDWTDTIGTQCTEGILTPLDKDYEEGLISSVDGISVDTKNNVPSETILQTIRLYDGYNELNIRNLSTEYVIRDYKTYDISLVRNGEKVQPSGNVELYIPVPHGFEHVRVARQNDDGTWTFLNTKVRNGIAIVEVDHFCMFVILDVDIDEMANPILTIRTPSTTTISYGDAIILHADVQNLPAGATIKWTASNDNFDFDVRDNGASCKITPSSSGDTIFTATVYDANNKVVSEDTQEMTSKAGFFDKIIAFFKKLFGLTKTIPEVFKF